MPVNLSLNQLIDWATERWERPGTIYTILAIIAGTLFWKFSGGKLTDVTVWEWVFTSSVCLLGYGAWKTSVRLPMCPKDHIGIGVAIAAEGKEEYKVIASDFVAALRRLLDRPGAIHRFALVEVPQHHVRNVGSAEDAERIRRNCRCHFLIWGTARRRVLGGREKHILNLEGLVHHARIPDQIQRTFSKEFSEIFPRVVHIDTENDVLALEFTSEWVDCVARYIIGIAAMLSGAVDDAESLFMSVHQNPSLKDCPLPPIKKIRQRVPVRLGEIYALRARVAYLKWAKNEDAIALDEISKHVAALSAVDPANYSGRMLRAIWHFVAHRNIRAALAEIRKCRDVRDAAWRYSYAFLWAYEGQMQKARRMYKAAFVHHCAASVPFEVEEFILGVLSKEPEKVQLYFCLGLVNWHGKQDLQQAIADFQKFLDAPGHEAFQEESRLAQTYINTLRGQLQDGSHES